jgi:mono/diheme cytochrome c family protein
MEQKPTYKDEMDWKDLGRKPEKLFGYTYLYILVVLVGVGVLYVWNLNIIGRNAVYPTILHDSTALIQDIPLQSPRLIPPVDIMKAGVSSPGLVNKGRDLFKANCASCHGDNGLGDGPSAAMLNPKPRNFHSPENWKNGSKVTQMYKTLEEGIPGGAMAAYNYLPPEDRFALIHYIRTLAGNQPNDSMSELQQLDATYHLAKGMNVAGQIPVKKALRLVEKEHALESVRIQETAQRIAASNSAGSDLLNRVAFDETRVVTSIVHMKSNVKSVNDFVEIVSADPMHSGFKASVVRMSADEWTELYQYLFSVVQ